MIDGLRTTEEKLGQLDVTGSVFDGDGKFTSLSAGSPSVFGQSLQVGEATTNGAGVGSIIFGTPFTNTAYKISITPGSTAAGAGVQGVIGSMQPVVSGLKITSGLTFFGGSEQPYDFMAVGLI